jgi:pilus assembly protein CpaC
LRLHHGPRRGRGAGWLVLALALASLSTWAAVSIADEVAGVKPSRTITVEVSAGKLLRLGAAAATVFVADPQIADVQAPQPDRLFVFGKKPGRTTLFALGKDGTPVAAYAVDVRSPEALLQAQMAEAGGHDVRLDYTEQGAVLSGEVPDLGTAQRLLQTAHQTVGPGVPIADQLRVTGPAQVNLRVRVAEVSREVSRQLGFNWSAAFSAGSFVVGLQTGRLAGSSGSLVADGLDGVFGAVSSHHVNGAAVLDAMATEGLVSLLAEPNLTAESGATANFLAGGEIPITVAQAFGTTSIDYKQYGVGISFTPTVRSPADISMQVRAEVSALDPNTRVELTSDNQIPALTTRRAETKIDLASGQSFAIAGLIRNDASNNVQKVPWLGDLPVLGPLFRSKNFQRSQSELVIVVTAYVVKPNDPGNPPDDPLRGTAEDGASPPAPRPGGGAPAPASSVAASPRRAAGGWSFQ